MRMVSLIEEILLRLISLRYPYITKEKPRLITRTEYVAGNCALEEQGANGNAEYDERVGGA